MIMLYNKNQQRKIYNEPIQCNEIILFSPTQFYSGYLQFYTITINSTMQAKLFFQIFCFAFFASLNMMTLVKSTPLPNGGGVTTPTARPATARPAARAHMPEAKLPEYDALRANGNFHKNGGRAFKHVEKEALSIGDHDAAATLKQGRKMAGKLAAAQYTKANKLVAPVA